MEFPLPSPGPPAEAAAPLAVFGTGALGLVAWLLLQLWRAWRHGRLDRRAAEAARDARLETEITRVTALREAELRLIAAERHRWAEDLAAAREARRLAESERDEACDALRAMAAEAHRQRQVWLGLLRPAAPPPGLAEAMPAAAPPRCLAHRQG